MKSLLLIFLLYSSLFDDPMREVEKLKLMFPSRQQEIFLDYENDNFSQKLSYKKDFVYVELNSSNFLKLNLNYRIIPDAKYIASLDPDMKAMVTDLLSKDRTLRAYMINISFYLQGNIRYTGAGIPQDAFSVFLNRKANCVGYSNFVKLLLDSAGIKNKLVKGFYLKDAEGKTGTMDTMVPVPHRWVEIFLPNGLKFYYDPQYQKFSANYITTKSDIDFKRVRRFKVNVIKKSRKLAN